jgi:hypothetical protein
MGWIKRITVIVVLLLIGLTGTAHGTPYSTWTLFSSPALHGIDDIRCFNSAGSTIVRFGHRDLAAAARAISPAAGIFSVSHTGLQPCFSLLDGGAGPAALFDMEIPGPAPFPPAFLLLTSGFPGLGFVGRKAGKRAAERLASQSHRAAHLLSAGPAFETLSRCSRK